jgi:hypothetical protein
MTRPESVSPVRRRAVIDALRRGTVPEEGLDLFAVGLERFEDALDAELNTVSAGKAQFKALRGEYGSGKTFFARWLAERAKRLDMATAEIQVSETETPLHKLETVYRRLVEHLATAAHRPSALRDIIEGWFYILQEDVLEQGAVDDPDELERRVDALAEQRLAEVARSTPAFSAALRAYRAARFGGQDALAEGLLAWIGGQPNVSASVKRAAGVKGDLDHFGALGFLQGLLTVLRDSGHPGLFLVLDEIETLQRVRSDVREKSLNALRQLMDEIDQGRFPGLYLLITGTPPFFEGTQGVQRAPALAQRLAVNFADPRFDNPRAVQIRLHGFDLEKLELLGQAVRDLYAVDAHERVRKVVDDDYIAELARAVTGGLGGKVGIAPRLFLRKLVEDVLDRVDQFPDFDPRRDYPITVTAAELNEIERNAASANDVDLQL